MAVPKRLILVDDDVELCEMLREYLASEGFAVDAIHEGRAAPERLVSGRYDLAILDIMLPGMGGRDILRAVRQTSSMPIIMLTARGDSTDRIVGLELGADDYLGKPFEPGELIARIRAVLRRTSPDSSSREILVGDIRVVTGKRAAYVSGLPLMLSAIEFNLLLMFVSKPGVTISRDELAGALGRGLLPFERTIDMHVVNLRKKLGLLPAGDQRILTVRGSGYLLAVEDAGR